MTRKPANPAKQGRNGSLFDVLNGPPKDHSIGFIHSMRLAGIAFKDELIADGKVHHFDTSKQDQKEGWYVFYGLAGAFGDHSKHIHQHWCIDENHVSYKDRDLYQEQIGDAQRVVDEERQRKQQESVKRSVIEFPKIIAEPSKVSLYSHEWPEPVPINNIKKDLLPVPPLPEVLVPEPYREWLVDIAYRMQCPLDYVAVGAIVVTASIIGAGCGIRPKSKDTWTVIPNLWGGIIGPPSKLKTPALAEVMKPLEHLEAEAREAYEKSLKSYLIELEVCKASKEAIRKDIAKAASKSDSIAIENAKVKLRNLQEPLASNCKRYSTNDATIEKMHELLSQNVRGLLLYRDELAGLLSIWDREDHKSDRCFYLEAWNGYGSKTMDRIGRGTIFTKNLCVSILGTTQPSKLLAYFQNALRGIENDGLLQRFQLLVYPDEIETWKYVDEHPNEHAQKLSSSIMIKLAQMDFAQYGAIFESKTGIPCYHFDAQAQELFHDWLTKLESKLRNNQDESIMIEHLTKYRKLMPALSLIFHLIEIASGKTHGNIKKDCAEQAVGWCDYLEAHSRRIYDLSISSSYLAARNLARKIKNHELKDGFDMREVYRKHWSYLKTKEEAEIACEILIESGWVRENIGSKAAPSKRGYQVNPKIWVNS